MAPAIQTSEILLAQRLASNEISIRTKALKTLRKYISLRSQKVEGGFTNTDLLKIWKGLFYCLWMQDKQLMQEELSDQISKLLHSFCTTDGQLLYFETFLQTIKREWNGIDRLRMDKFFQLIRFVFRQAFEMLKRREWESSLVNHFLEVFTVRILQDSEGVPDGLMLHILDVYMTELAQIGSAELTADQNFTFIDPFCKTMAKSKHCLLVTTISKSIFSTIVDQASFAVEDLIKELHQGGESDPDSDQASEDEEKTVEQDELKMNWRAKKVNGLQEEEESSQDEQDEILDMGDDEKQSDVDIGTVLQFDYGMIAERLLELGSHKNTPNFNRTRMYHMVKIFRDLNEGIFPQEEEEDANYLDSSDDELFNKGNKKKRKKGKKAKEGTLAKKHKAACEVGEMPREADQINVSSISERECEVISQAQDNRPDSKKSQVKANIKVKKRKGKKLKSDILEFGEEGTPESRFTLKNLDKKLTDGYGVEKHPSPKKAGEAGGKEQTSTLPSNGKKSGKKHKKCQASECIDDMESIHNLEGKKKKKCLTADEGSATSGAAVQMEKDDKAPEKSSISKKPEDPSGASPVEIGRNQTDGAACMLGKTKHKKKMIIETRADAKIFNTLQEKTHVDIEVKYTSSDTPTAEVITTGQEPSNITAPLLMKTKKQKSKGKTKKTSFGDMNMSSDCTGTYINSIGTEKDDAVKLLEPRLMKKDKKKKRVSSKDQEFGIEVEWPVVETLRANTVKQSSCTPTPLKNKKPQKRKMLLAKCQRAELNMEGQPPNDACIPTEDQQVDLCTKAMPKKKLKMKKASKEASFISFQGEMTLPTPLFCKIKPKGPSTPLARTKAFHTPQSETKKVTFGLKNNKTTEFKKTDRSLLVSPVGSSRVAFDPKKMPLSGVLKSPTAAVSVKKTVSKRRPTAADFF